MGNSEQLFNEIATFIRDTSAPSERVLGITGKWGVGKTFTWKNFEEQFLFSETETWPANYKGYSYCSCFGVDSIETLGRRIIANTFPLNNAGHFQESTGRELYERVMTDVEPYSKKKVGTALPKVLEMIQARKLLSNLVICIDDIERLTGDLSLGALLGYVDDLSRRIGCKVILIYNQDRMEEDDDLFRRYREKVIDFEYELDVDPLDLLVVGRETAGVDLDDDCLIRMAQAGCLNARHTIRACRTYKNLLQELSSIGLSPGRKLKHEIFEHIFLIGLSVYGIEGFPQFPETLIDCSSWESGPIDLHDQGSTDDIRQFWIGIATDLQLQRSDYDAELTDYLLTHTFDGHRFARRFSSIEELERGLEARAAFDEAWNKYLDLSDDGAAAFTEELSTCLEKYCKHYHAKTFSDSLNILERFGVDVIDLCELWVAEHEQELELFGDNKIDRNEFPSDTLWTAIKKYKATQLGDDYKSILSRWSYDELIDYSHDLQILSQTSTVEWRDWLKSSDPKTLALVRGELLPLGTAIFSIPEQQKNARIVFDHLFEAISQFAAESEFNRYRAGKLFSLRDASQYMGDDFQAVLNRWTSDDTIDYSYDLEVLSLVTNAEWLEWLKSMDTRKINLVRGRLLPLGSAKFSDQDQKQNARLAFDHLFEAISQFAAESEFNRHRASKLFNLREGESDNAGRQSKYSPWNWLKGK